MWVVGAHSRKKYFHQNITFIPLKSSQNFIKKLFCLCRTKRADSSFIEKNQIVPNEMFLILLSHF